MRRLPDLGADLLKVIAAAIGIPLINGVLVLIAMLAGLITFGQLLGDVLLPHHLNFGQR